MYHANVQNADIVLHGIYLAVVQARQWIEISLGSRLLTLDSDRIFDQPFPNRGPILRFVGVFFRAVPRSVDDSVLLAIRQIVFECCLA